MGRKSQTPTLVDVAREARVSLKTASRALNKDETVSKERVARIQAAIAHLGYRPNELARGLKSHKSNAIGMIVANFSNPFIVNVIRSVQEVARSNGYVVIITSSGGDPNVERAEIETLVRRQIEGLVLAPAETRHDTFSQILPDDLRVVTFDQLIRAGHFDSVTITNRRSARAATQHMLGHGLHRIVAVGARSHLYTTAERIAGYCDGMSHASVEPRVCVAEHESLLTAEWLQKEVFDRHAADAIFPLNWICSLQVLRGLRALGKKPGQDIPLFCFDDFDLGEMLTPGLSVVRQPSEMLGREAARLLFERLNGGVGQSPRSVILPAELIVRCSCGCH